MSGIHTVPFHIGDFISGTIHMDAVETGAYIMLLMAHYQIGVEGLPDDDRKLARIAKVSLKKWQVIKPVVMEKFDLSSNFWTHIKVKMVIQKVEDISEMNRVKALKKHNSSSAAAEPMQCNPETISHKPIDIPNGISDPPPSKAEKPAKPRPEKNPFVLPEWVPSDLWQAFLEVRQRIRAPNTDHARKLLVNDLEKLRSQGHDPSDVLKQSISRGWRGVFAIKPDWNGKSGSAAAQDQRSALSRAGDRVRDAIERSASRHPEPVDNPF